MAQFIIEVTTSGEAQIRSLENSVRSLDTTNARTTRSSDGFTNSLNNMAKGALAYVAIDKLRESIVGIASSFVNTASEFEKLGATMKTLEGDSGKAKQSMDWIKDFAKSTPFELAGVTESFLKLRAYGLDPTNGLLKTLGDTASGMGKDLNQAVEAIADAVVGENERLKEFGIKASLQGEKIRYTWTNSSNEAKEIIIANNADVIQSTLTTIWNEKYAGAMIEQSTTWAGMLSNMKDNYASFQNDIMNAGLFQYLKALVSVIGEELQLAMGNTDESSKVFSENIISGIEGSIRFAGFMYDAFESIGDVFKSLYYGGQTAFYGLQVVTSSVALGIQSMFEGVFNKVISGINKIIDYANSTGLVSFGGIDPISFGATEQSLRVDYLKQQYDEAAANARQSVSNFLDTGDGQSMAEIIIAKTKAKLSTMKTMPENVNPSSDSSVSFGDVAGSSSSSSSNETDPYTLFLQNYQENKGIYTLDDMYKLTDAFKDQSYIYEILKKDTNDLIAKQNEQLTLDAMTITQKEDIAQITNDQIISNNDVVEKSKEVIETISGDKGLTESFTVVNDVSNDLVDTNEDLSTAINEVVKATDELIFQFSDTLISALQSSGDALKDVFNTSTTSNTIGYAESLSNALELQRQLALNPLDVTLGAKYKSAFDTFLSASGDYLTNTQFSSYESMRFAQATVGGQTSSLQNTSYEAYDVLDSMNSILNSINDALSDGVLTTEESTALTGLVNELDTKNQALFTGTKFYDNTDLAKNATVDGLYKGTAISATVNTISGFATSSDIVGTSTSGNLYDALVGTSGSVTSSLSSIDFDDTNITSALTGTNSVSTFIKDLMGDATKGIQLSSVVDTLPSLSVNTGLDVSDLSSIATNTNTTASNVASSSIVGTNVKTLDGLRIKSISSSDTGIWAWNSTYNSQGGVVSGGGTNIYAPSNAVDPRFTKTATSTTYTYYSKGGFTGNGSGAPDETGYKQAGIVHDGEWVAPKWMVNSNAELFNSLENARQNKGFANGGYTSQNTTTSGSSLNQGYLFAIADGINKLNGMIRQVTSGGNAMLVEMI